MSDYEKRNFLEQSRLSDDGLEYGNTLFRNDGQGRFEEVSDAAGMETFWPWGVATGDFDNDGREDVFLPSGMGHPFLYWPSCLMHNDGDGTFSDVAADVGIEPPADGRFLRERIGGRLAVRSSRCAAVADFDGDGRLDLMVVNFNDRPYYFKNQFLHRHFVSFGRRSGGCTHRRRTHAPAWRGDPRRGCRQAGVTRRAVGCDGVVGGDGRGGSSAASPSKFFRPSPDGAAKLGGRD